MPKQIAHDQWQPFLLDLSERFAGSPTTIRVRDHHLEEHELGLARDLPLANIELDLRPKETVRLQVTQPSGTLKTVEVEYPKTISLLDEEGAAIAADKAAAFQIVTASQTFFVHIGLAAH